MRILTSAFALLLVAVCLSGCGEDPGSSAEFATACDGAYRDANDYCRTPDGRFAKSACCDANCDGAYSDDHGYCRLPNGQFATRSCCESASCTFDADAVLQDQGLDQIASLFPADEVCAQTDSFDGDVSFGDALSATIASFLLDGSDIESPLELMANIPPEDDAVCPDGTPNERVFCYLNRSSTLLAITYQDGEVHGDVYPAENVESVHDNWIFYLYMPELSDHLRWAVVQRQRNAEGDVVVFNYGFN